MVAAFGKRAQREGDKEDDAGEEKSPVLTTLLWRAWPPLRGAQPLRRSPAGLLPTRGCYSSCVGGGVEGKEGCRENCCPPEGTVFRCRVGRIFGSFLRRTRVDARVHQRGPRSRAAGTPQNLASRTTAAERSSVRIFAAAHHLRQRPYPSRSLRHGGWLLVRRTRSETRATTGPRRRT